MYFKSLVSLNKLNIFVNNELITSKKKLFVFERIINEDPIVQSFNTNITILQLLELVGLQVPVFCYHSDLSIAGNCRMCLVELVRSPKPVVSCTTTLLSGMQIFTDSSLIKQARENILEFLLINHPLDCPICDQGGECDLQDLSYTYGSDRGRFKEYKRGVDDIVVSPIVKTIMTRCIHCTRCIRYFDEVVRLPSFGTMGRGNETEINTYVGFLLDKHTNLVGNVVDLCPVGALTSKPHAYVFRGWELESVPSVDFDSDGFGNSILIDVRGNEVSRVMPSLSSENILGEWITDRVRYGFRYFFRNRISFPMLREKGTHNFIYSSWAYIFKHMGEKYRELVFSQGGSSLGFSGLNDLLSLRTFEYLFNIDGCSFVHLNYSHKNMDDRNLYLTKRDNISPDVYDKIRETYNQYFIDKLESSEKLKKFSFLRSTDMDNVESVFFNCMGLETIYSTDSYLWSSVTAHHIDFFERNRFFINLYNETVLLVLDRDPSWFTHVGMGTYFNDKSVIDSLIDLWDEYHIGRFRLLDYDLKEISISSLNVNSFFFLNSENFYCLPIKHSHVGNLFISNSNYSDSDRYFYYSSIIDDILSSSVGTNWTHSYFGTHFIDDDCNSINLNEFGNVDLNILNNYPNSNSFISDKNETRFQYKFFIYYLNLNWNIYSNFNFIDRSFFTVVQGNESFIFNEKQHSLRRSIDVVLPSATQFETIMYKLDCFGSVKSTTPAVNFEYPIWDSHYLLFAFSLFLSYYFREYNSVYFIFSQFKNLNFLKYMNKKLKERDMLLPFPKLEDLLLSELDLRDKFKDRSLYYLREFHLDSNFVPKFKDPDNIVKNAREGRMYTLHCIGYALDYEFLMDEFAVALAKRDEEQGTLRKDLAYYTVKNNRKTVNRAYFEWDRVDPTLFIRSIFPSLFEDSFSFYKDFILSLYEPYGGAHHVRPGLILLRKSDCILNYVVLEPKQSFFYLSLGGSLSQI